MKGGVRSALRHLAGGAARLVRPESILLVPVPEAAAAVRAWQGRDLLPDGVPAHVTVMYPFLSPRAIDGPVERELARLAASIEPFTFRLSEVGRFPGVLYLRPEPAEPFVDLVGRVTRSWPACKPYRGRYPQVVPHVTLATGGSDDADTARLEPLLPIACRARELTLLTESARGWRTSTRFALRGSGP